MIEETIELMREYIKTRDESLSQKISKNLLIIAENDKLRKEIIDKTELGLEFLDVLILYIRVRYNYLISLLMQSKESKKPLFSNKLIFDFTLSSGAFPISSPVRVLGINVSAMREALLSLRRKYSSISRVKFEEKIIEIAPILSYIKRKRKILEKASRFIVREFGSHVDLKKFSEEIIDMDLAVRVSYIQALLKLLSEGRLKVRQAEE